MQSQDYALIPWVIFCKDHPENEDRQKQISKVQSINTVVI